MPGAGLERGDDITDIQTLGRRLDAGHKTPLQAPGLCAIAKSLEAATFVLARKRALHAYRVGRLARQDMKHPPAIVAGDSLVFGPLVVEVVRIAGRRVEVVARGDTGDHLWQAMYAAGAPVQYAHRPSGCRSTRCRRRTRRAHGRSRCRRRDGHSRGTCCSACAAPASRSRRSRTRPGCRRLVTTRSIARCRGPSATRSRARTIEAIATRRARGGRVIAVGTTVVRALESAARSGELSPAAASRRCGSMRYTPRVVDGLVSGLHAPGESHFELLRGVRATRAARARARARCRARAVEPRARRRVPDRLTTRGSRSCRRCSRTRGGHRRAPVRCTRG